MKKLILITALASSLFADSYSEFKCNNDINMIVEYSQKVQIDLKENNYTSAKFNLDMILSYNKDCMVNCLGAARILCQDTRPKWLELRKGMGK